MARKRAAIGKSTPAAKRMRHSRSVERRRKEQEDTETNLEQQASPGTENRRGWTFRDILERRFEWQEVADADPLIQERDLRATEEISSNEHNDLVKLFKTVLYRMPLRDYVVVVRSDKTPAGEHGRRFNSPTGNEVAIVIAGEEFNRRDIILYPQSGEVRRIVETHPSYDPLQYPLLFWKGEIGYDFTLKMVHPRTCQETDRKVSAMHYYAYRLTVRSNGDNHILKCRRLLHQFVVDMYAKIETE